MKQSRWIAIITGSLILSFTAVTAWTQTITKENLAKALQGGGYVVVMRHASSPHQLPDAATANVDNMNRERQLDEVGRRDAKAMGAALRKLKIPVAQVLSSPTYRALETARLMGFTDITAVDELGNEGMRAAREDYAAWLRAEAAEPIKNGNRLLITHGPNVTAAFPDVAKGMEEGEALIFRAGGEGGATLVGRLKITEWPGL